MTLNIYLLENNRDDIILISVDLMTGNFMVRPLQSPTDYSTQVDLFTLFIYFNIFIMFLYCIKYVYFTF